MLHFIQRLQKEPEPFRKQFALLAAIVVTLIIFGVWFATSGLRLGGQEKTKPAEAGEGVFTSVELSPLQVLEKQLSSVWGNFKQQSGF